MYAPRKRPAPRRQAAATAMMIQPGVREAARGGCAGVGVLVGEGSIVGEAETVSPSASLRAGSVGLGGWAVGDEVGMGVSVAAAGWIKMTVAGLQYRVHGQVIEAEQVSQLDPVDGCDADQRLPGLDFVDERAVGVGRARRPGDVRGGSRRGIRLARCRFLGIPALGPQEGDGDLRVAGRQVEVLGDNPGDIDGDGALDHPPELVEPAVVAVVIGGLGCGYAQGQVGEHAPRLRIAAGRPVVVVYVPGTGLREPGRPPSCRCRRWPPSSSGCTGSRHCRAGCRRWQTSGTCRAGR